MKQDFFASFLDTAVGTATLGRIQASFPFKLVSALGGLLGLIASAMTIMLGWDEMVQLLTRLIVSH